MTVYQRVNWDTTDTIVIFLWFSHKKWLELHTQIRWNQASLYIVIWRGNVSYNESFCPRWTMVQQLSMHFFANLVELCLKWTYVKGVPCGSHDIRASCFSLAFCEIRKDSYVVNPAPGHFLASSQIEVYPIIKLYGAQRLVNVARRFNRHLQMLEINHPRGCVLMGCFTLFLSLQRPWNSKMMFRLKEGGRSLTHFALKSSFEWPAISSDPCYSVSGWVPQRLKPIGHTSPMRLSD